MRKVGQNAAGISLTYKEPHRHLRVFFFFGGVHIDVVVVLEHSPSIWRCLIRALECGEDRNKHL